MLKSRLGMAYVAICAATLAVTPVAAQDTLEKMRTEGALVGFATDPPWGLINADGSLGGALPEMDIAILERMGVSEVEPATMEFGAMIASMLSGRTDFNTSMLNITPERCQAVIYAKPSACSVETLLVSIETAGNVASYEDVAAQDLRIGLIPGGQPMTGAADEAGIDQANRVPFTDYADAMALLEDGRVDVVPATDASAADLMRRYNGEGRYKVIPITNLIACSAASFRPDDTELRDAYNVAFDELLAEGTIREIFDRYELGYTLDSIDTITSEELCTAK